MPNAQNTAEDGENSTFNSCSRVKITVFNIHYIIRQFNNYFTVTTIFK